MCGNQFLYLFYPSFCFTQAIPSKIPSMTYNIDQTNKGSCCRIKSNAQNPLDDSVLWQ